jgi:hypothetical protein
MLERYGGWWAALTVLVITTVLVVLDITDRSVDRYWSRHSFGTSVLSGVLVLLLTVLIVDRVARIRQVRNQSRAVGAQAAIIVGQAQRAADAISSASPSADDRQAASDELRSYTQMLLISAPVLIDAKAPRTFLETAQRVAYQLFTAVRDADTEPAADRKKQLDTAVGELRQAAAPLLAALNPEQRAAITSHDGASSDAQ